MGRLLVVMTVACLMVFSVILQIFGCATPGWLYLDLGNVSLQSGLWFSRTCVRTICETKSIDMLDDQLSFAAVSELSAYRGFTICGIVLGLLCLPALLYISRKLSGTHKSLSFARMNGAVSACLSGIFAISAAAMFGDKLRKAHDAFNNLEKYGTEYVFPYSLFLTGLGGLIAVIATLVLVCSKTLTAPEDAPSGQGIQVQPPTTCYEKPPLYPMVVAQVSPWDPPSYQSLRY